jgi:hypothetical protein
MSREIVPVSEVYRIVGKLPIRIHPPRCFVHDIRLETNTQPCPEDDGGIDARDCGIYDLEVES